MHGGEESNEVRTESAKRKRIVFPIAALTDARGKSQKNGTFATTAARLGTRPDTASATPPPWLMPTTPTRAESTSSRERTASTARSASANTRRK